VVVLQENIILLKDILIKFCKKYDIQYKSSSLLEKIMYKCRCYADEQDLVETNKRIVKEILHELKLEDTRDQFITIQRREQVIPNRHLDISSNHNKENEFVVETITPRKIFLDVSNASQSSKDTDEHKNDS